MRNIKRLTSAFVTSSRVDRNFLAYLHSGYVISVAQASLLTSFRESQELSQDGRREISSSNFRHFDASSERFAEIPSSNVRCNLFNRHRRSGQCFQKNLCVKIANNCRVCCSRVGNQGLPLSSARTIRFHHHQCRSNRPLLHRGFPAHCKVRFHFFDDY